MSQFESRALEVSVVVPTRNRAPRLAALLDSMAKVRAAQLAWEVIVVDNGSTDGTAAVVRQAASSARMPLRYVYEPEPGLHAGRHRGAQESRGEVVAYLDDDTQLHEQWLRGADPVLRGRADAVVCRILPQWEAPVPSWLEDLVYTGVYGPLSLLDLGQEQREVEPVNVFGGGCFIRRSLVFDLNGFHPDSMPAELLRFRGDGETGLMRKFAAAGYRAWYDPSSVIEHAVPAERMTHVYLRERFYRQGVSNSFSELREELLSPGDARLAGGPADGRQPAASTQPDAASDGLLRVARRRVAGGIRSGRGWASRNLTASGRSRLRFGEDMWHATLRGWDFHRRAVEADAGVMAWVRQPHYMGVSLSGFCSLAGPQELHDDARTGG